MAWRLNELKRLAFMGLGIALILTLIACSSSNADQDGVTEQDEVTEDGAVDKVDEDQQGEVTTHQKVSTEDSSDIDDKGSSGRSADNAHKSDRQDKGNQDGGKRSTSDRTEQTRGKQPPALSETVRPDDAPLTKKEAEALVRKHLELENRPEIHIQYDHDEQGRYVIQVYEAVGQGETSHTATLGWYYVDPKTREIESMF